MPPVKIGVFDRSPLSMLHAYPELIMAGGIKITSIKMGQAYVFLIHHGRRDLANYLIEQEKFKWHTEMIEPFLQQHGITVNAKFVAQTDTIFSLIIGDQMEQESSPFRQAMLKITDGIDRSTVEFLVSTSGKKPEKIISTGKKYGDDTDNYPGFNTYGHVLATAAVEIDRPKEKSPGKTLKRLLIDEQLFHPVKRSVLILSDSQWRYFDTISCRGLVVPVSGGCYADIVNVIRNAEFSLSDFVFVVIYCGTNTYLRENYSNYQRQRDFTELKHLLVNAHNDRDAGTILFSCAFDHPKVYGNPYHARWIKDQLQGTGIRCLNWRDEGNPYLLESGRINKQFFHNDNFHLNQVGVEMLWRKFADMLPGLEHFSYTVLEEPESVNRQMFADDTAGPSQSRKRRIDP